MRQVHTTSQWAERLGLSGRVTVLAYDNAGRVTDRWEGANLITDAGLNLFVASLRVTAAEGTTLQALAWGDSSTAVSASDVALGNQLGQQEISTAAAGATGVNVTTVYLGQATAVGTIEEFGWWAGPAGDVLYARVLYSRTKTNTEGLQVVRTDTLTRT